MRRCLSALAAAQADRPPVVKHMPAADTPEGASIEQRKAVATVDRSKLPELFTPRQLALWPPGYAPTPGAAYFLFPQGLSLQDLIAAREDMRKDSKHELQRDLAQDYHLWARCTFSALATRALKDDGLKGSLRRVLSRDRLPKYADVVRTLRLPDLSGATFDEECRLLPGVELSVKDHEVLLTKLKERRVYPFRSQASLQSDAMAVLEPCRRLTDTVRFTTPKEVRNVLHSNYDGMGTARYLAMRSGDHLQLSRELVRELALYLRRRWDALGPRERERPIVSFFSNGRLPHELNETGVLPVPVVGIAPPLPSGVSGPTGARRMRDLPMELPTPEGFAREFTEARATATVPDALQHYEPALTLMEPHCDRDWVTDVRGYWSVREVTLLGQVDSPAMGSFSYPWLSFGVSPGPDTYWVFNERLQRYDMPEGPDFMPTLPPFQAQGYEKLYIDRVSQFLVCSNDTHDAPHQARCVTFRRTEAPSRPDDAAGGTCPAMKVPKAAQAPVEEEAMPEANEAKPAGTKHTLDTKDV